VPDRGDDRRDDRKDDRIIVPPPGDGTPNVMLRWPTWAITAGLSGAVGLGFAIDGKLAHDRLDDILANPEEHFFGEAETARKRWKRDTAIANVAFATTGVLAVGAITVAVVMRNRGDGKKAALVPWVGDGAGFALVGVLP
jgi:hypothetical protein